VTRSLFQYPTGMVGVALLLLRLSVAGALVAATTLVAMPWAVPPILLIAVAVILGILTRAGAVCGVIVAMLIGAEVGGALAVSAWLHGLASLALSMTGAGGYSIDARLFGRTVLTLE